MVYSQYKGFFWVKVMAKSLLSGEFQIFSPPNQNVLSPAEWAQNNLKRVLSLKRRKIALFDNFPSENVDYYKALQEAIAKEIPLEQERPLICLN